MVHGNDCGVVYSLNRSEEGRQSWPRLVSRSLQVYFSELEVRNALGITKIRNHNASSEINSMIF